MTVYDYQLRRDQQGRIIEKTETVADRPTTWTYAYDEAGRLTGAQHDGHTVCDIGYDREGRRSRDYFPHLDTSYRNFEYTMDDRLSLAGNNNYIHDENGFRSIWNNGGQYTLYQYAPDHRLLSAEWPETAKLTFDHDDQGRRAAKYRDGKLVEAYAWHDLIRMATFFDGKHEFEFAYREDERTPFAMRRDDGTVFGLFYDQIGSLRVVVDIHDNVIKEVQYDPFGGIISDSAPDFRIPLGFAGGLHDPDLGFVRFGWRDKSAGQRIWTLRSPATPQRGEGHGRPESL